MKIKHLVLTTLLATTALAYADDPKMKPGTADKMKPEAVKLTDAEVKVLGHQHHLNMMEIEMGQYAQKNAGAAGVKDYAKVVVADHQKADRDLMALAKKQGIAKIPKPTMTDDEKKVHQDQMAQMAKMKKMKGAELDRAFLQMMVTDHERELGKLDATLAMVSNPELKQLLEGTRPVQQAHADKARELQKAAEQTSSISDRDTRSEKDTVNKQSKGQAPTLP